MKNVYEVEIKILWAGKDAGSEKRSLTVLAANAKEAFAKAEKHGLKQGFSWVDDEDNNKRKYQAVKSVEVLSLNMTAEVDVI